MSQRRSAPLEDEARLGQHIVSITESAGPQLDLLSLVFQAGLRSDCQCLFIADRTPPPTFIAGLRERGCDVEKYLDTEQFVLVTSDETYLRSGHFDPGRMFGTVADAISAARRAGFRGLCASGELSWLGRNIPGSDRVLEYEFRVNYLDDLESAALVCLYDQTTLPARLEGELKKIHPFTHRNGDVLPSNAFVADKGYAAEVPLTEQLEPPADSLTCSRLAELISADADGELLSRRRQEVARHVAHCPACRAWMEAVHNLKQGIRAMRTAAPVPDDFWETLRSRLRSSQGSE